MLHPRPQIRCRQLNKLKRSIPWIETLLFQQSGFLTRAMEDGQDGLAMFNHVTMQFQEFSFLSRTDDQNKHAGSIFVPYFTPPRLSLITKLSNGHVRNHRCNTHVRTKPRESSLVLCLLLFRDAQGIRPSTTASSANNIVPPAAPRIVLCE